MFGIPLWKVLLFSFLLGTLASLADEALSAATNCEKHPIYCQIIKNRTDKKGRVRISKRHAMKLSNAIYNATRKYKVPANIYTAILMQESRYSLKAKGCHQGLRKLSKIELEYYTDACDNVEECKKNIPKLIEDRVCADFGMSQIYYKTARRYKLDLSKLTTNTKYSIEAGAKVLRGFKKRYARKETDWWTRYNASSKIKRDIYKQLVERFL
jgi:hypothetical protein